MNTIPSLYYYLTCMRISNLTTIPGLQKVILIIIKQLQKFERLLLDADEVYDTYDDMLIDNPSITSDRKTCDFLPSCTVERPLGDYVHRLRDYDTKNSVNCNKKSNGRHKALLPGILVIKCIHGITLGIATTLFTLYLPNT
jgi:hypothetical protein